MSDILNKILHTKSLEIKANKLKMSLRQLEDTIAQQNTYIRDFIGALRKKINLKLPAIIAEIKKASPSKGIIRADFDPIAIAKSYEHAGAACLSILTDEQYFQGSAQHLQQVRAQCNLPILRKDFIIDSYQIYESRAMGADCILLILAALGDDQLHEFISIAKKINLAVLLEVHDANEMQRALKTTAQLIGVNNRNLRTFTTDLNISLNLAKNFPNDRILITESGIQSKADVLLMRQNNIHAFLIGETFMRAPDPGKMLTEIFSN